MVESSNRLLTGRLEVRHPTEADRPRFVELFRDDDFMAFSGGRMSESEAGLRFDRRLGRCRELSSGMVIGYTGVDWIELEGRRWLEWGYRLVAGARGRGYATEASAALLAV